MSNQKKIKKILRNANLANVQPAEVKPNKNTTKNKKIWFSSFRLYLALRDPGYSNNRVLDFIIIMLISIFSLSTFFSFMASLNSSAIYFWRLISIVALLIVGFIMFFKTIRHIANYPKYKNWENKLTFNLIGWNNFKGDNNLFETKNWYTECSITIRLDSDCRQLTKDLINSEAAIFCRHVNAIENIFNGSNWVYSDNTLKGSANCSVFGYIQRFVSEDLNLINEIYKGICSVEILVSETIIERSMLETASSD